MAARKLLAVLSLLISCPLTLLLPPLPPSFPPPLSLPQVQMGPLSLSPMGLGTWAWGNRLLWAYDPAMDAELQAAFNLAVARGINFFDTADSYGTGDLNGRSEMLLGRFLKEYPGEVFSDRLREPCWLHVACRGESGWSSCMR